MRPDKLYKYCNFKNDNDINNLENCKIWMSNPEGFNDPFDSKPELLEYFISDKDFQVKYNEMQQNPSLKSELNMYSKEQIIKILTDAQSEIIKKEFKEFGVSCFSSNGSNNVMWYYYSMAHTGFTIEMSGQFGFFDRCHKVSYTSRFPKVDLGLVGTNKSNYVQSIFLNKSPEWSHEEEWRFINNEKEVLYEYHPDELFAVNIGELASPEHEKQVRDILKNPKFAHVELRRMKKTPNSFKLKPEAI